MPTSEHTEQKPEIPYPGMRNLYKAITGKDCDEKVALGMATAAVSTLLYQKQELIKDAETVLQHLEDEMYEDCKCCYSYRMLLRNAINRAIGESK